MLRPRVWAFSGIAGRSLSYLARQMHAPTAEKRRRADDAGRRETLAGRHDLARSLRIVLAAVNRLPGDSSVLQLKKDEFNPGDARAKQAYES
jgi:hypothetical protein